MGDKNVPLTINSLKYTQYSNTGTAFILNKMNFYWKELIKFPDLTKLLLNRKIQKNYFLDQTYKKPTIVIKNSETMSSSEEIITMSICIPCYDEEWCEISGTLRSLSKNILIHRKRPDSTFQLHITVFIIQDGWSKSSESLKEGIVREWGCPNKKWVQKSLEAYTDCITIIIPDYEIYYPSYNSVLEEEQVGVCVYPIFITKNQNAQKFNSHLLFFSLCYLQKPDCVFLTDTGTIYDSDCIYKLVEYLVRKHKTVIGVTARQSIMSETHRSEIKEYPHWWYNKVYISDFERIFKHIFWWISPAPLQGFEFESTFLLSTAMFNLLGALAVLPGPCQLLWWDHLETNKKTDYGVLDLYFKHLNMNINNSGIIKTNTLLAEDRVLSFAMVLRTNNIKTVWVNGAKFSYEPILTWVKLLGQRRRWINGTVATYLYYLFDQKGKDELIMSGLGNNKFLLVLWYLQVYQSFLQILSPSFFSIALYESVLRIMQKYPIIEKIKFLNNDLSIVSTGLYLCFYILCILISIIFGKKTKYFPCYNIIMEIVYYLFSFVNSSVSIFIMFNIVTTTNNGMFIGAVFYILLFVWLIPLILSLFLSVSSSFNYILYSIPFLCQIAQYVSFIPVYSFARLHDLSWGNRDSTAGINMKTQCNFLFQTLKVNILSIIANFGIVISYVFLFLKFGHSYYIYIPIFVILFLSLIIQIGFAIIYLLKLLFQDTCKKKDNIYLDDKSANMSVMTYFDDRQSVDI